MKSLMLLMLVVTIGCTGCATLKDAKAAEGNGEAHVYGAGFEQVWAAMPDVVKDTGLDYVSANRDDHTVLAQKEMSAFSYGENVAIFVQPAGLLDTRVEVVSKRALATNIFAKNWSGSIFEGLDSRFKRRD